MPSSGVYQPGEDPFQEQLLQFTSLLKLANLSQRYKQGKQISTRNERRGCGLNNLLQFSYMYGILPENIFPCL